MSNPNDPDVLLIARRERELKKHSAQIGRMCTLWSGLEFDIALLLRSVAGLDDPLNKNVFLGAMDLRSKISAVLAIAFKRKPSDDWYDRLARECPIFCVSPLWSMLPERSKDDDDFQGTAGRTSEGLRAA